MAESSFITKSWLRSSSRGLRPGVLYIPFSVQRSVGRDDCSLPNSARSAPRACTSAVRAHPGVRSVLAQLGGRGPSADNCLSRARS